MAANGWQNVYILKQS